MNTTSVRRAEAKWLRAAGIPVRQIADRIGVSDSTVLRWTDPAYYERCLRQSREAKRRRGGTCKDCGGRTSLGNSRNPDVAERCQPCRSRFAETELRYWTRDRVLDAARQWAKANGRPPTANDWRRADPDRKWPPSAECSTGRIARREGWNTWNEFLRAAGLSTWERGQHGATLRKAVA